MRGDPVYWSLARILKWTVWRGKLLNPAGLPSEYPVVFIANHAAALGPIAITSSLPIRLYSWVISDMMEWENAPDYLRKDFIEPQLHISSPLSLIAARLLSQVSVRLLRRIECIPVWNGDALIKTYHKTVDYLLEGRNILIFPEDPSQELDELYGMTPFYKGFTRLGEIYYERTKRTLSFFPLAVHPIARVIKIGDPIKYYPQNDPVHERLDVKHKLESTIHELYLSISS